jgi:hypothetical protein
MRILVLIALCGLVLASCDGRPGKTTVTISRTTDDIGVDATRATFRDGTAELDCVHSKSGHCYFVIYTDTCPAGQACAPRVIDSVTLAAGESTHLKEVPGDAKLCVGHDATPVPPACHVS